MKRRTKVGVGLILATLIAVGIGGMLSLEASPNVIRARAILTGPPGSEISGEVVFTESPVDKYSPVSVVSVQAQVKGLTPGLHGFHVHEVGICVPPTFASAGGHFDPGPAGNSTPVDVNHPFHTGDLPNLKVNNAGVGELRTTTSRITLDPPPSPLSIFDANGSTIIVHLLEDQGNPTYPVPNAPGSNVAGGSRIACGVVEPTGS